MDGQENANINSTFYKENTKNYESSNLPDDFLFFLPGFNLRTTENKFTS